MEETRDLIKTIRDTKGIFHAKMGSVKYRNSMYPTEAEDVKKRNQEYTELYKEDLNDLDNHNDVITHLEQYILECKVKWALGSITTNKCSGGDGIPIELFQSAALSSVRSLRSARFFAIPCNPMTAACQASLSITNSQSFLKLMFIECVMPSNPLILCHPLLLLPLIFPGIRVFSNDFSMSQQIWKTHQ